VNLKDLHYVVAVADTHHFGQAAERCFVSQPTLSGQIKKLEVEFGVTLFERTNRSVVTTSLGELVVERVRDILDQVDSLKELVDYYQQPLCGPFRLGVIPSLSPYLIPLILEPFKKQCPDIRLLLWEEMTDTLEQRLRNHQIDAALLATEVNQDDLISIPLFREPFWLIHPKNHYLSQKKIINREDLLGSDLLLLAEGHCLADQVMDVCSIKDRASNQAMADMRAASLTTLVQMVATGYGCTLLPALALQTGSLTDQKVVVRQLDFPDTHRNISLVFRKSFPRRELLDAFIGNIGQNLPASVTALTGITCLSQGETA